MFFTSADQAVRIEESKFFGYTGAFPKGYPYIGAAMAAISRGELSGGALHLSSLVRLNADLDSLRTSAPHVFNHFVEQWQQIAPDSPQSVQKNAAQVRGWRMELLTAAELAIAGVQFEIGDPNPRVLQGQPDLLVHHAGTRLAIECGSVEPDRDDSLEERVFNAAWNKAFDRKTNGLRDYVGPNALLILDITSVAARHAAESGGTADLGTFSRSIARSLSKRVLRHGTDWGAILLHFVGIYAEQEDPAIRSLKLDRPAWGVSTRGSSAVLSQASEPHWLINRSFYSIVAHRPSEALNNLIMECFPMTKTDVTAHLEHLPSTIVY